MNPKFLNLASEKKDRIINAALKEFAQKGWDDASTNAIVKEAGISKGLLFHYFESKKALFLFLYDYSAQIIKTEYFDLVNTEERDIFARLRQAYLLKLDVIHRYPWLFEFSAMAAATEAAEVKPELESKKQEVAAAGQQKMFANNDTSKFRKGVDVDKAQDLIYWAIAGLAEAIQKETKGSRPTAVDYEKILAQFDAYLDVLRTCFYQ